MEHGKFFIKIGHFTAVVRNMGNTPEIFSPQIIK